MTDLWPQLKTACLIRSDNRGWQREPIGLNTAHHERQLAARPRVILGGATHVDMTDKLRWIDPKQFPVSNGEASGQYLRGTMAAHGADWIGYRRGSWEMLATLHPPTYYAGGGPEPNTGIWAMVDLSEAYWAIIRSATLDMNVRFDRTGPIIGIGRLTLPRPFDMDRDLGHAFCGLLTSRTITVACYGKLKSEQTNPKNKAPDAVAWIYLVLNAVAWQMIRLFQARMVMIDCYAVPAELAQPAIEFLARIWGLASKIKAHGAGALYGTNTYQVGVHQTETIRTVPEYRRPFGPAHSNLVPLTVDQTWKIAERKRFAANVVAQRGRPDDIDWTVII